MSHVIELLIWEALNGGNKGLLKPAYWGSLIRDCNEWKSHNSRVVEKGILGKKNYWTASFKELWLFWRYIIKIHKIGTLKIKMEQLDSIKQ